MSPRLSPRKVPVQARAVETRERILDAAARVFSRHGYAAGTTNRIADEAGLSVGSLYQYFPNKDAILVQLVRRHIEEGIAAVAARLDAVAATGESGLDDLVGAVVDAAVDSHVGDPALHQVLFEESPRPPELLAELHSAEGDAVALAAGLLAVRRDVAVADTAMAARIVVTTIESLVHRMVATRGPQVDLVAFRHELVDMVVRYLHGGSSSADLPHPTGSPDVCVCPTPEGHGGLS